jgi:hypothetical protein
MLGYFFWNFQTVDCYIILALVGIECQKLG